MNRALSEDPDEPRTPDFIAQEPGAVAGDPTFLADGVLLGADEATADPGPTTGSNPAPGSGTLRQAGLPDTHLTDAGADGPPRVTMVPLGDAVVGGRLSMEIHIFAAHNVGSVPFHLVFNPGVLRFEAGREGPFMSRDGRATAFFAAPTSSGDRVVVGLSRLGRGDGADGSGLLCTLDFEVTGSGPAGMTFQRAKVRNAENQIVPAFFEPALLSTR